MFWHLTNVIDVTESSNHSKRHYIKPLERVWLCDWEKGNIFGDIRVRVDTIRSIDLSWQKSSTIAEKTEGLYNRRKTDYFENKYA